ncbi:MAG: hypothetical protein M2R45_03972 [Verrucomicrobia subdivision 3 bacterium]|nr:hypothetical protein [Limisphaerales bacterium]MCS1415508.1 hypothetical protein [Limisphaerales bacterium]
MRVQIALLECFAVLFKDGVDVKAPHRLREPEMGLF